MTTLAQRAAQYGITTEKQFFPVNSLRLLYFTIAGHFTKENQEVITKIGDMILKVEAVFSGRQQFRAANPTATAQEEFAAAQPAIQDVYTVVTKSPTIEHVFEQLFTYSYPLQDELFLSLYQDINSEIPLNGSHLALLLKARAMDSFIFSSLIGEIISTYWLQITRTYNFFPSLQYHLNLAYQLNDLVDTIVFAKDDLESNVFSPFHVIRKIAPQPEAAKELIITLLNEYKTRGSVFPFPEELQAQVVEFYDELTKVVH